MSFRHPYEKPEAELLVVRFEHDFLGGTYNPDGNEKFRSVNEEDFE